MRSSHAPYQAAVLQLAGALQLQAAERTALLTVARRRPAGAFRLPALLPLTPTPLLGREHEVANLFDLLAQPQVRLVTESLSAALQDTPVLLLLDNLEHLH